MNKRPSSIPKALSVWFVIHFFLDMLVAIPLFFFPKLFLNLFGFETVNLLTTRLVAAAFFAIGIESLLGRNGNPEAFRAMLNLKIIWSLCAVLGIVWSLVQEFLPMGIGFLIIFLFFHIIWVYWRIRIRKKS